MTNDRPEGWFVLFQTVYYQQGTLLLKSKKDEARPKIIGVQSPDTPTFFAALSVNFAPASSPSSVFLKTTLRCHFFARIRWGMLFFFPVGCER